MSHKHPSTSVASEILVIAGGILTTVLSLGGVYWLANHVEDYQIMGWYILYLLPAGAMIAGMAAGSGYGITSWVTGKKVGGGLIAAILVVQVAGYCAAQWIEFKSYDLVYESGETVDFLDYYDATTQSMAFTERYSDTPSEPLGVVGYLFRFLELVAFALGGLLIPILLRSKPYCEVCYSYMKTRSIGLIPAAVTKRKALRKVVGEQKTHKEEMEEAFQNGLAESEGLAQAAQSNDSAGIREVLIRNLGSKKETGKLFHRIQIELSHCPKCSSGQLSCYMQSGHGKNIDKQEIFAKAVSAGVVKELIDY